MHGPDGAIAICGYPEDVFPPTDFHTATLVGDTLWLIGALGYSEARREGQTPVFTLDTRDFHIERVATTGEAPGWIYKHRARLRAPHEIVLEGGHCFVQAAPRDPPLIGRWVLDLQTRHWRRDN